MEAFHYILTPSLSDSHLHPCHHVITRRIKVETDDSEILQVASGEIVILEINGSE